MAQEVGYYENDVIYTEGPFVIVNPHNCGWRIEAELKGHHCPVLPDISIFHVEKILGLPGMTNRREEAAKVCDQLNGMVRIGEIVLDDKGWWVRRQHGMG